MQSEGERLENLGHHPLRWKRSRERFRYHGNPNPLLSLDGGDTTRLFRFHPRYEQGVFITPESLLGSGKDVLIRFALWQPTRKGISTSSRENHRHLQGTRSDRVKLWLSSIYSITSLRKAMAELLSAEGHTVYGTTAQIKELIPEYLTSSRSTDPAEVEAAVRKVMTRGKNRFSSQSEWNRRTAEFLQHRGLPAPDGCELLEWR